MALDKGDAIAYALWGPDWDRAIDVTEGVKQVLGAGGSLFASTKK